MNEVGRSEPEDTAREVEKIAARARSLSPESPDTAPPTEAPATRALALLRALP
jgi:hypothetical protein